MFIDVSKNLLLYLFAVDGATGRKCERGYLLLQRHCLGDIVSKTGIKTITRKQEISMIDGEPLEDDARGRERRSMRSSDGGDDGGKARMGARRRTRPGRDPKGDSRPGERPALRRQAPREIAGGTRESPRLPVHA